MDANQAAAPLVLLWLDEAEPFFRALAAAGMGEAQARMLHVPASAAPPAESLRRAAVLVAWNVPPGTIEPMAALRWVHVLTAGADNWLARPDLRPEIVLTNARGVHGVPMPENILAAMFHVTKPLRDLEQAQRRRHWQPTTAPSLAGATLGIVGAGTIGMELARKAAALGMRVVGTKATAAAAPPFMAALYPAEELDRLLAQSDYVVLLAPLTRQTQNMIDATRLAAMRKEAWLLNFGRGGLVVDADLLAAVENGTIRGAVLDVFREEPLPEEHPFWSAGNILVTPHIGGRHPGKAQITAEAFVANLRRYLGGEPLHAVVDRARGY